ncbi:hypothetical protein KC19_2G154200 [Ceratodon purpureus]|uniref:F-box domain-containing protein n=1 Tax=Ceratodon purpureus TaxID=3225 RepID=A0A8T0IVZ5_CERPU|nr:hypothetical protein KC19_2G154200 [Ceratodon purpureus]
MAQYTDALRRVDQVIQKLKDCSMERNEIERIMTELKADALSSDDYTDTRRDLLVVAKTVRDMLNVLKTGLEGIHVEIILKMQVAIEETNSIVDRASEEDNTRLKRTRVSTQTEPGSVCGSSSKETRVTKKEICTHSCTYHPHIVNPGIWSKLPEDLVVQVFARLPIPRIIGLRKCSEAWSAMSDSSSFKGVFAEANPKLFGLLGWDGDLDKFRVRIVDVTTNEWHGTELELPKGNGYMDALFACDGGLVCFVPEWESGPFLDSVFVCNPLTNCWKKLPDIPLGFIDPVLVQLVTEGDGDWYRVILVYREKLKVGDVQTFGTLMYDSKTGSWSKMDSGLVYGTGNTLLGDKNEPMVFDCATKRMIDLEGCPSLQDLTVLRYANMKDRVFVLHVLVNPDSPGDSTERLVISEYTWESSTSDLRKVNDYEIALRYFDSGKYVSRHDVEIFTCSGMIVLTCDNLSKKGGVRQLVSVYDLSAGQWRDLPQLIGGSGARYEKLVGVFLVELRWDVVP